MSIILLKFYHHSYVMIYLNLEQLFSYVSFILWINVFGLKSTHLNLLSPFDVVVRVFPYCVCWCLFSRLLEDSAPWNIVEIINLLEIEAICFYKRDHFKKDFFNTYLDICFWSSNRKEKGEKEIGKLCQQVLSATDFKDSDSNILTCGLDLRNFKGMLFETSFQNCGLLKLYS